MPNLTYTVPTYPTPESSAFAWKNIFRYFTGMETGITLVIDPSTATLNTDYIDADNPSGKYVISEGTLMTKITTTGAYGPFASGAVDGRQTLTRGEAYILSAAVECRDDAGNLVLPPAMGGYNHNCRFRTQNLKLNGATVAAVQAVMPTCEFM